MAYRFHRLVLFTPDPERARAWYERAAFAYLRGYDGMHWFRLGEGEIMLHPAERAAPGPTVHVGVDDVDALFAELCGRGLEPAHHDHDGPLEAPLARPWGDREFELTDPDGQVWCFTEAVG